MTEIQQWSFIMGVIAALALIGLIGCLIVYALLTKPASKNALSIDEIALLRQAYAQRWVYPAGVKPEVIGSLFRRGLLRPEGQEVTLTEAGKALFAEAGK
jgi:hypothetical protein